MNRDELVARLRGTESEDFEVKTAAGGVPEDGYKTVSAFANTAGGWLVFGVQEVDAALVASGVPDPDGLQNDFLTTCRSANKLSRPVEVRVKQFLIENKQILAFYIRPLSRFDNPLRVRVKKQWQAYIRVGSGDHRCSPEEEARFLRDASYEPFDSTVCENATLEDLDVDAIKWLRGVIGLHDPARADPEKGPAEFLSDFGLLRRDRLTHAAALFFGLPRLIAHLKPGGIVDFRLYYGSRRTESNTRWDDRELCDGHVVGALRALLERFHRLSPQPFEMEPNGVQHRAESRDYLAVREAFVNLLVHQDYTDRHRTARILWYRDRVLFENPGDSFLSPEEMLEGGISDPRNPLLVQLMRQAGYAEQAGRGIRGIIETWRRAGRESPEIINERGRKRYRLELPWQEYPISQGKGGTEGVEPKFEAARPMARSADRTKTTTSKGRWDRDRLPELRLDRDRQKTEVYRKLAELVRSDTRRVLALVAYAAAGNAIAALWEQLRHQLDFELYADIAWLRLDFPADRSQLRRELEHELRRKLDATADESVAQLLRRHAPRSEDSGRATILWLNWGVFGPGNEHQEPLNSEQLGEWLRFSSQFLGTHCPDDLRVVSYLAFEVQESRQGRLQQTLQEHRRQPWCRTPAFQLKVLPPLGRVSDDDLLDFLEDPASSSCDPGIQAEIAQRVVVETGGEFEPTAALLQEAERGSWYDLLARLRREQGGEFSDDEPF